MMFKATEILELLLQHVLACPNWIRMQSFALPTWLPDFLNKEKKKKNSYISYLKLCRKQNFIWNQT